MFVTYPAIFYKNKDEVGYTVVFPDFDNGATEGKDQADALYMAQDYIGSWLYEYFIEGKEFPKASLIDEIKIEDDEFSDMKHSFVSLVGMNVAEYVKRSENRTVRRNVSIPSYLNEMVKKRNINVSQILQEALKAELQLNE